LRCRRCESGSATAASGRANRRALNNERAGRTASEGQEIGYMAVGKGKSKRGTAGTGGV
jgi:hypothetical protein